MNALRWLLERRVAVLILVVVGVGAGLSSAPFDTSDLPGLGWLPRAPVPVDAIPDLGDPQQIVFTAWPGRSPQDVEDQLTYPLTVALLGIPGVKVVRASSMLGFSSIYILFEDGIDFYWSRSRVLEKLSALPAGALPDGVQPQLGPDASALGQVYWYTLEGRDEHGRPAPGWSLEELRTIQDFLVQPALQSARGITEVAGVGGHVRELQIDVDPDALRVHRLTMAQVAAAVAASNRDVGARTLEINQVEYVVRGVGQIESPADVRDAVIRANDGVPLRVRDVADVRVGPAERRGLLDKGGVEAVGGVAVVRHGANPMAAIAALEAKIAELKPGLPVRTLDDGRQSRVTVVPFYNRGELIAETVATLKDALTDEVLVAAIVVLIMLLRPTASMLVALLLPIAVLLTFVVMKAFGIQANIVALSGIAIAIGTLVDMGIVVVERMTRALAEPSEPTVDPGSDRIAKLAAAVVDVAPSLLTATGTTVISFLPVFALEAAEGRLFRPLAATKTIALVVALVLALFALPALASLVLRGHRPTAPRALRAGRVVVALVAALLGVFALARHWAPLGPVDGAGRSLLVENTVLVGALVAGLLLPFLLFLRVYPRLLGALLRRKLAFLVAPALLVACGLASWRGGAVFAGWLPGPIARGLEARFSPLGEEFMPRLNEGSFLWMPTIMPHGSLSVGRDVIAEMDRAIAALPEVRSAVGKLGRAESALDPAPLSMIETIVTLLPEYGVGADGERVRNWRPEIRSEADVWAEVSRAATVPGATGAPMLQPIAGRIVMLQTGLRAPLGVKVRAPTIEQAGAFAVALEPILSAVDAVRAEAVLADRVVGKPWLELHVDREAIGRHGLRVDDVQQLIAMAVGGHTISAWLDGRARHPIRVRYPRELRGDPDAIARMAVPTPGGATVPLGDLVDMRFARGPQVIKSEGTFPVAYTVFDGKPGRSEVEVAEAVRSAIDAAIADGQLEVPAGLTWRLAGSYENKLRADARLRVLVPLALALVFILVYLQFRSVAVTAMIFSGVAVAMAGGFVMLWLYGQPAFLDVPVFGSNLRDVLGIRPINLSVAVWVGFIALVGIATDDGVLMASFLERRLADLRASAERLDVAAVRKAIVAGGRERVRPCLMTTATTVLALLPVLGSTGRGSDVMAPMAVPIFGGMIFELLTLFVVPVLYAGWHELRLRGDSGPQPSNEPAS